MRKKTVIQCEKCNETRVCITWYSTPYGKFRLCEKCAEIPLEKLLNLTPLHQIKLIDTNK